MLIEHEFIVSTDRCRHCGTRQEHHDRVPQGCVPRWSSSEKLRPEPARRVYASEDTDSIFARIAELRKERDAVNEAPPAALPAMDHGDCCQ